MMRVSRSIVPSFFTVGNMFCGFFSVIAAFDGNYSLAAWMIFAGAFLDAMDGKIARFTNSASRFGVEYDSLADVISFGFAPSLLLYAVYARSMGSIVGILISFLPLLFGSIRLARFNLGVKDFEKGAFVGLPIPIAALTLASFILFSLHFFDNPMKYPKIMLVLTFLVSILMVSTIHYEPIPQIRFKGTSKEKLRVFILIGAGILLIIFPYQVLFPLMVLYIFSGLINWIIRFMSGNLASEEGDIESED
jgi:CDP-diacylglycerol--serine O-phosphatidyltransferase